MTEHPLRRLRHDRLMSQQELASAAKIALRTVVSIERREKSPLLQTRAKLLRVLIIPFDQQHRIFEEEKP